MRCRANDLAVVVLGDLEACLTPSPLGKIVRVLTATQVLAPGGDMLPAWHLETPLQVVVQRACRTPTGLYFKRGDLGSIHIYPDAWLRPIRDSDGVDEALQIFLERHAPRQATVLFPSPLITTP
jgi:hypothetical protein